MRAERVQVSWDSNKSKWVRIEAGAEVIRRHTDVPKDADDQTLAAGRAPAMVKLFLDLWDQKK